MLTLRSPFQWVRSDVPLNFFRFYEKSVFQKIVKISVSWKILKIYSSDSPWKTVHKFLRNQTSKFSWWKNTLVKLIPRFSQNWFFHERFVLWHGFRYEEVVRSSWNFHQRWSQRLPRVFFFVFNFNLSVKSYKDFRVKKQVLWRTLPYFPTIKIEGSKIFSNKKNTPG